jgi:hypothetical protein
MYIPEEIGLCYCLYGSLIVREDCDPFTVVQLL